MGVRHVLAAAALLAAASDARGAPARQELKIAVPGETLAKAIATGFASEAASGGVTLSVGAWSGHLATLQARAAAGATPPDLVLMPNAELLAACDQGLLTPRPAADGQAGAGGDDAMPAGRCGVPGFLGTLILAWDRSRAQTAPGWADFWDVARSPGKRGLPRRARGTLEAALLADGVATGDIYRTLASSDGLRRAFRKLEQLKPYVVWWDTGDEAVRALASGGVLMTLAPAARLATADAAKAEGAHLAGLQWKGGFSELLAWGIPQGAAHEAAAAGFLDRVDNAAAEAAVTASYPLLGAASASAGDLPPSLRARMGGAPGDTVALMRIDDGFWRAHPEIELRFKAWLAG